MPAEPVVGETRTVERTFTVDDVERFASVSRDTQSRHTKPDDDGRVLVHGLLTATLPTQIGSDLEVLAEEMTFSFRRPVYTGERIECTWTFASMTERDARYDVAVDVECTNPADRTVLTGTIEGRIQKAE